MRGIDVSKHQGKIDWKKVKASGVEFAIIRAGYGRYASQIDLCFKANAEGASAAGIPAGVYWYSYAVSADEAAQEAAICLQAIKPYRDKLSLPVFFDQEYEPGIKALDDKRRTDICIAFMNKVQAAEYRAGLYCSLDWWKNWLENSRLTGWPVWIAQYANACGHKGDNLIVWQYSSKGKVPGISGNVDLNEGYDGLLPQKDGWKMAGNDWYYYRAGAAVKSEWLQDGGYKYYLSATGAMLTGVQKIGGKVYAFNTRRAEDVPRGAMIVTDSSGAVKR